ncbi:LuxR C-terminal-related transcriptional regulator [Pendulispora brunnea]|uniref:LuxR C-terminal-related transcriptional regulator n=1 Tax=Pendulispora brunnea TaxID=2905690 RepID=A0ABZ2K0H0_9BACT
MGPEAKKLLDVVEAAYRLEVTDREWLEGLASACLPVLDEGFGISVFEFHYKMGAPPTILQAMRAGMPEELEKMYPVMLSRMDPELRQRPFLLGPCTTGSHMMGLRSGFKNNELMQRGLQKFGIYDTIWITAAEPSGWGCGLHAGRPRISWPSRSTIERWTRVAAHLSAAARLRRRWAAKAPASQKLDTAEAVFSPQGHVHHAQGAASSAQSIEQLRRSVLDVETARRSRHEGDAAMGLRTWKGLVEGRWSLLDHFENDGTRYIVAKENAPSPPEIGALTLRERQILGYAALGHENKVIAYDLGIAHATVKVLMARAASKLRVRSRAEVISTYREMCSDQAPSSAKPE